MAKFIELTTKLGKTLVNLDLVDTVYDNKDIDKRVLSFAGTEEYICIDENYDEIVKKIKMEDKKNAKNR